MSDKWDEGGGGIYEEGSTVATGDYCRGTTVVDDFPVVVQLQRKLRMKLKTANEIDYFCQFKRLGPSWKSYRTWLDLVGESTEKPFLLGHVLDRHLQSIHLSYRILDQSITQSLHPPIWPFICTLHNAHTQWLTTRSQLTCPFHNWGRGRWLDWSYLSLSSPSSVTTHSHYWSHTLESPWSIASQRRRETMWNGETDSPLLARFCVLHPLLLSKGNNLLLLVPYNSPPHSNWSGLGYAALYFRLSNFNFLASKLLARGREITMSSSQHDLWILLTYNTNAKLVVIYIGRQHHIAQDLEPFGIMNLHNHNSPWPTYTNKSGYD